MRIKRENVKSVVGFVVNTSVSSTLVTLVHQNTFVEKPHHKVQLYIAAYVLGAMVGEQSRTYTDKKIDDLADAISNNTHDHTT